MGESREEKKAEGCSTGRFKRRLNLRKKIDAQGFGIIDGADGSKVPFILSDVMNRHDLEPGQKVVFSVRRVNEEPSAMSARVDRLNMVRSRHPIGEETRLLF